MPFPARKAPRVWQFRALFSRVCLVAKGQRGLLPRSWRFSRKRSDAGINAPRKRQSPSRVSADGSPARGDSDRSGSSIGRRSAASGFARAGAPSRWQALPPSRGRGDEAQEGGTGIPARRRDSSNVRPGVGGRTRRAERLLSHEKTVPRPGRGAWSNLRDNTGWILGCRGRAPFGNRASARWHPGATIMTGVIYINELAQICC